MKLSQLNTDQLADVLVRLTPPLCRILRDERTLAALDGLAFTPPDAQPPLRSAADLWEKLLPLLLTEWRGDLFAVLEVLTGKEERILRSQSGLATLRDIAGVWDEDLARFFSFAGSAAQERS